MQVNTSVPADSALGHELVDDLVAGVVDSVAREMRGQPASMVLEIMTETLARRLPGIAVDEDAIRLAAARASVGVPAS